MQVHSRTHDVAFDAHVYRWNNEGTTGLCCMEAIMKFCILYSSEMQKWIQRYEEAKSERSRAWVKFMGLPRGQAFPQHLAPLQ